MRSQFFLICPYFLIVFTLGSTVNLASPFVTQTDKGLVMGEILTTVLKNQEYLSFQGIPYAKPPVGKLRFKVNNLKCK